MTSEAQWPSGIDLQGGTVRLRIGFPQQYIGKYKTLDEVSFAALISFN